MFVSPAYAQAGGLGGSGIEAFIPLILIFVVFWFLLIRPQQKKQKQHREMLAAIKRGDRVVTGGGIVGVVTKAEDLEVMVEIAKGVRVRVQRGLIASVLAKTAPAGKDGKSQEAPAQPAAASGGGSILKSILGGKGR